MNGNGFAFTKRIFYPATYLLDNSQWRRFTRLTITFYPRQQSTRILRPKKKTRKTVFDPWTSFCIWIDTTKYYECSSIIGNFSITSLFVNKRVEFCRLNNLSIWAQQFPDRLPISTFNSVIRPSCFLRFEMSRFATSSNWIYVNLFFSTWIKSTFDGC